MSVRSKWDAGRFVAWDSEGWNVNGVHELTLLADSFGNYLLDERGLRTAQILDWIVDGMAGRRRARRTDTYTNATHIIFGGSYDANMWLCDLHPYELERLWRGRAAYYTANGASYRIEYRHRKYFMVRRSRAKRNRFGESDRTEGGVIWDVLGFYQSSFVEACRKNGFADEIDEIERMKRERKNFAQHDVHEVISYCLRECQILKGLAERLRQDIAAAEIRVNRWDGAGALAAALLQAHGVKQSMGKLPPEVDNAARYAYFGGRIELVKFGVTTSNIWKYDINSAYPAAATRLPCLAHGSWSRTRSYDPDSFGLWRVTNETPENAARIGALPFRARTGRVYFPWQAAGWYWTPEVNAAQAAGSAPNIRHGLVWRQECEHTPFAWLSDLYRYRQQLKHYGGAGEKAIKLGINACYGKLAQKAGGERKIPTWHNLAWAGYITSYTRAVLFSAAFQAGDSLIALATDAVFSERPLDLPCSKRLGEWDAAEYNGMTTLQSGVYWLGNERITPDARRGFDGSRLKRHRVMRHWQRLHDTARIHMNVFVGMGLALQTDMAKWRTWQNVSRDIALWPDGTKRTMLIPRVEAEPWRRMIPTQPTNPYVDGVEMSYPTVRPWDEGTPYKLITDDLETEPPEMTEAMEWQV